MGWPKGKKRSLEERQRISQGLKGRQVSEETRRKLAEAARGRKHSDETKQKMSHQRKGRVFSEDHRKLISSRLREHFEEKLGSNREPFVGTDGYLWVSGLYGHPLECKGARGKVAHHRLVLFEKLGPGPQECHWNQFTKCGNTNLIWGRDLVTDHLDEDVANNDPDNLVPSCLSCNALRGRWGNYWEKDTNGESCC